MNVVQKIYQIRYTKYLCIKLTSIEYVISADNRIERIYLQILPNLKLQRG